MIVTPPPPAINIPRFYYPRGLPALGQAANHDAAIAAIETAFAEFEEEKADIYEMGKIAKVNNLTTDIIMFSILDTQMKVTLNLLLMKAEKKNINIYLQ